MLAHGLKWIERGYQLILSQKLLSEIFLVVVHIGQMLDIFLFREMA
jgi:hypothetical protein